MDVINNYNDLAPSYADLPMEIIVSIFRYLHFTDLQAAAVACRRWLEASQYAEFQGNVCLKFSKLCLSDKLHPAHLFLRSERFFSDFYLEEITLGSIEQFLPLMGRTTRVLTFDSVDLTDKQFCSVLQEMQQLRSLTVTRCSPLFMAGQFLDSPVDRKSINTTMCKLRKLSLRYNQYLSDAILLRLTSLTQSLESLDMSGCHIAYHCAIQRRFYPEEQALNPSESILTFKFILHVVNAHRTSLRELNFSNTLIGGAAMTALCDIEGGLRLERLHLSACRQLNPAGITGFLKTQAMLRHLDLSDTLCVTDSCIDCLLESAPLLDTINFKGCAKISNSGAIQLANLQRLRSLNLSHCDGVGSEGIMKGIARVPNAVLRELHLSHLNLCEECIKLCAQHLTQLRVLNLGNCINGVTDDSVQCIIEHLRWLRELYLEDCFRITDAALTGINVESQLSLNKADSTNSMDNFHPPICGSIAESLSSDMNSMKISLRSKAEEEIVRDANRKKAMLAIYALNLIDGAEDNMDGVCIQQLKGLHVLNLKGCNKISDVSLKYGFKFLELRRLLLSNCQQISLVGMEAIVLNCPSIEELDLSDCYNINDKSIEVVTSKLSRLRSLNISGCTQLTDHSLDSILVNCKVLQTLSVYRCRRMYTGIEERLMTLSSLRTLNMDHSTTMDNADIFRLKKRLDY